MKALKFSHAQAEDILAGKLNVTWRINDDKDISVDDTVEFIDKKDGQAFGTALINQVTIKRFAELSLDDVDAITTIKKYYGDDIAPNLHIKIVHFSFSPYPYLRSAAGTNLRLGIDVVKMYADGGSRGNPGHSASGFVLYDADDNVVKKDGFYLGITTNNQAEYQALKSGLEEAKKFRVKHVDVYMDSLLVINQMKGIYKVKNRDLWPIHQAIRDLCTTFEKVTFTHVPRALNKEADAMVNEVLDRHEKRPR